MDLVLLCPPRQKDGSAGALNHRSRSINWPRSQPGAPQDRAAPAGSRWQQNQGNPERWAMPPETPQGSRSTIWASPGWNAGTGASRAGGCRGALRGASASSREAPIINHSLLPARNYLMPALARKGWAGRAAGAGRERGGLASEPQSRAEKQMGINPEGLQGNSIPCWRGEGREREHREVMGLQQQLWGPHSWGNTWACWKMCAVLEISGRGREK